MVSDAHRDAAGVEVLADVVRVDALEIEGREPDALDALGRVSEQPHAVDAAQPVSQSALKTRSWAWTASIPTRVEVVHRRRERDRLRDGLRSRFEPLRRRQVFGAVEGRPS